MTPYELVGAVYFAGLGTAAAVSAGRWGSRGLAVAILSLALAATIVAIGFRGSDAWRAWAPHLYLAAGYWIPGLLARVVVAPTAFERWLCESDQRLRPALPDIPAPMVHVTELAYLLCYPLVPGSFILVWTLGSAADVARFWVAVLLAGYACYATLPWLLSRPPRLLTNVGAPRFVGAMNVFVLSRVSHQLNTFPSGHVAVSLAAAGALWPVSPWAGAVVGVIAAAVAIGAAAGRYHYVVDVLFGVAVAAMALVVASAGRAL